jgi:hypothetical protein
MGWERQADGSWRRYLVREQHGKSALLSELTRVKANHPVCFHCLSQDVVLIQPLEGPSELRCSACGVQYTIM